MRGNHVKLDRLLEELAVALARFEDGDTFPQHWERPIALGGVSLCSLSDFPDRVTLPSDPADPDGETYRGFLATVSEPPIASVLFAAPHRDGTEAEAERALVSLLCREIFPGADPHAHEVRPVRTFEGNPVFALLTTHAPPDSLILSLRIELGSSSAIVCVLCDGKHRRRLEASD